jgi:hypothetical protein
VVRKTAKESVRVRLETKKFIIHPLAMLTRRQSVALELESARADIQRLTAQLKAVTDERDALQVGTRT